MGAMKVGSCILLVLVLISFLGVVLGEVRELEQSPRRLGSSAADDRDENTLESSWAKCKLELIKLKEVYEGLGFDTLDISSIIDGDIPLEQALADKNIKKALSVLHSFGADRDLFDCLREEHDVLPVSGEEVSSTNWYLEHLESLFSKLDTPNNLRRSLAHELLERTAESPSTSPSRGSHTHTPSSKRPASPPAPPAPPGSRDSKSKSRQAKDHDNHVTIVSAVVVTAVVTFFISAVLFMCCRQTFGKGSGSEYKDDRPLLHISLSDSSGSSGKSYVVDNSFKKFGSQSYDTDPSQKKGDGSVRSKFSLDDDTVNPTANDFAKVSRDSGSLSSYENTNVPNPPLKPPPGRVIPSPPGVLPLKPPPGRAIPLPPEPPAALRPPPGRTGPLPPPPASRPPPPPPPVGLPLLKLTPGSVVPRPPPGAPPAPRAPPPPPLRKPGPAAPPPPKPGVQPPRPPISKAGTSSDNDGDAQKAKLKPFFWDKVLANPDHSMVWHQIKSGSFQFNEEMIETLFGYTHNERGKMEQKKESSSRDTPSQFIQLINPKKAQNLAIMLRALNVTNEEVRDALHEGKELPPELLENLLKMAPTPDEELKLQLFSGEITQLGPAERFLKMLIDLPFAFKRLEALFFMSTIQEDVAMIKESFTTLEVACKELRSSRIFRKLLEAVLKTGNRMNVGTFRGDAQAFKLDTLLKLSDVRGTDGKTTLLHFVVQEIIRTEGIRAHRELRDSQSFSSIKPEDLLEDTNDDSEERYRTLGLQVVSSLGNQLENVKKAAGLDPDTLTGTIAKLGNSSLKTRNFLDKEMESVEEESGFHKALRSFVQSAEGDAMFLLEEEKRIMGLVKSTVDYFHGNAGKEEGLRLFVVVRDFLIMLDKACREVRENPLRPSRKQERQPPSRETSIETPRPPPSPDLRQRLFPAIAQQRMDESSSDDD
ncbi:Formin-like protein [Drosera capensis]